MKLFATAATAAVLALSACTRTEQEQTPAEPNPIATAADREWVSVAGTVSAVTGSQFTLEAGANSIIVEMDDYDWYSENPLLVGDEVIVSGRMDSDLFEARTIEAATVYVEKLNEHFYASSADEEGGYRLFYTTTYPTVPSWISITGRVADIHGENITLDAGFGSYRVDTSDLGYDPFDNRGDEQIDVGERVVVYGTLESGDFFENRRIRASAISTISEAS